MIKGHDDERLYRALIERDEAFEGVFVVGVKTTGIFCRPGCGAKKPLERNCEFFPGPKEALFAGYRACMRCRPLERAGRTVAAPVERLLKLVDEHPGRRIKDDDLRGLGIDPSGARRAFRKHCGMTFQAYQRARRMGQALETLRERGGTTRAMTAAGYESVSGFGAAFAGVFGAAPTGFANVRELLADWIVTPLGAMVAVADDRGLYLLEFHDRRALETELHWLRKRLGAVIVPGVNGVLRGIAEELGAYFDGKLRAFRTPLMLEGSAFQLAVWRALLAIPAGTTRSYAEIAAAVGNPKAGVARGVRRGWGAAAGGAGGGAGER